VPELTDRCQDCWHTYGAHLGGFCSGPVDEDLDPLGEGSLCGCDEFCEYEDDWDDDGQECTGCGDWAEHLSSDGLCDGCVILGPPRGVVTVQPAARYL
jgi:hypothetical protein